MVLLFGIEVLAAIAFGFAFSFAFGSVFVEVVGIRPQLCKTTASLDNSAVLPATSLPDCRFFYAVHCESDDGFVIDLLPWADLLGVFLVNGAIASCFWTSIARQSLCAFNDKANTGPEL